MRVVIHAASQPADSPSRMRNELRNDLEARKPDSTIRARCKSQHTVCPVHVVSSTKLPYPIFLILECIKRQAKVDHEHLLQSKHSKVAQNWFADTEALRTRGLDTPGFRAHGLPPNSVAVMSPTTRPLTKTDRNANTSQMVKCGECLQNGHTLKSNLFEAGGKKLVCVKGANREVDKGKISFRKQLCETARSSSTRPRTSASPARVSMPLMVRSARHCGRWICKYEWYLILGITGGSKGFCEDLGTFFRGLEEVEKVSARIQ